MARHACWSAAIAVGLLACFVGGDDISNPIYTFALGGPCSSDVNCESIPNSRCLNNFCACKETYQEMWTSACGRLVNTQCPDGKCDALNTKCERGFCVCESGFHPNVNQTFCYKEPKEYNDLCAQATECSFLGDGQLCFEGRCVCQSNFRLDGGICKYTIDALDGECREDTQVCYLNKDQDEQRVECRDGKCQCKKGATASPDKQSCNTAATASALSSGLLLLVLAKLF